MLSSSQAIMAGLTGALHAGTITAKDHADASAVPSQPLALAATEHLVAQHVGMANPAAINWLAVIQQIQQLAPQIVALINLFKQNPPSPNL